VHDELNQSRFRRGDTSYQAIGCNGNPTALPGRPKSRALCRTPRRLS
jgi:hypothetical protein